MPRAVELFGLLGLGCLGVLGCGPGGPAPWESARVQAQPEQEVRERLETYYQDFSARDWERFADHFWPGATLTTVWQPPDAAAPVVHVVTVAEFVAQAPAGPGSQPIFEERMVEADIRVMGQLATAWVRFEARFGRPGEVAEWTGVDVFTLIRHEGVWRFTSLAYGDEG